MNLRTLSSLALCACAAAPQTAPNPPPQNPTANDAKVFIGKVNDEVKRLAVEASTADWIKNTFITDDTERNAASANDRLLAYGTDATKASRQFDGLPLDF